MAQHMTTAALESLEIEVRALLESDNLEGVRKLLNKQQPPDIADVLDRLESKDRARVFELLTLDQAAEALHEMGTETIRKVFADMPKEKVGDLLDLMAMDDAAEILTQDVPERQQELLTEMQPADAAEVRDLLKYPAQSAGRLMTEKFVRIRPEMTVEETIAHLRKVDPEVETLTDLYVLNPEKQLIGVVSLREVITAPSERRLQDIMTTQLVTVPPEMDREEVARLVSRYDFLAIPVVAPDKAMLGIITVDDIIHVLVEEQTEDAMKFAAVEGGMINQPYFTISIRKVIRTRIGWLLLLFLAETLTGSVLRVFEAELEAVVALSFFIPLLIGTGGNTGAQTVSTIIRGIALKDIRLQDSWRVIRRELGSGLLIGLLLGIVAFLRTVLWGSDLRFCLVIALTILVICTWANTVGSIIPLVAQRLKIDPAVVSAPLITTLVDATGLAIYMLIAKAILGI